MNQIDDFATVVFAIVVRTVGLLVAIVAGAPLFYAFVSVVLGGPNAAGIVIIFSPVFVVGLWLLRGAPWVVRFAFPDSDKAKVRAASTESQPSAI